MNADTDCNSINSYETEDTSPDAAKELDYLQAVFFPDVPLREAASSEVDATDVS